MGKPLWSYQEIKYIRIHATTASDELTKALNEKFHKGEPTRTLFEVNRIRRQRSIF